MQSEFQDRDYPSGAGPESVAVRQRTKAQRVPLPAELVRIFSCKVSFGYTGNDSTFLIKARHHKLVYMKVANWC